MSSRDTRLSNRCLCGSQKPFSRCCGPHLVALSAPTAEALMRSRYSAFCQGNVDYLIATHHPSMRSDDEPKSLAASVRHTAWKNLLVIKTQKGQKKDKTGVVEFVAAYQQAANPSSPVNSAILNSSANSSGLVTAPKAKLQQLHERSRFVREKGQWFYLDGDILPPFEPKRSQPCWCGSGKPFKRCHAAKQ
ncbi:MAG: YchJ family protein [Phormidesmis sp.]